MNASLLTVVAVAISLAFADAQSPRVFWTAEMGDAGIYTVDIDKVVSASVHRYVVDSRAQVNEFTVVGEGSGIARFYHVGKLRDASLVQKLADANPKTAERVEEIESKVESQTKADERGAEWNLVVKNYPTSTHAHTVEFLLKDTESARQLFESLRLCIRNRRETTFREGSEK